MGGLHKDLPVLFTEMYHVATYIGHVLCLPYSYETCDTYKQTPGTSNFIFIVVVKMWVSASKF